MPNSTGHVCFLVVIPIASRMPSGNSNVTGSQSADTQRIADQTEYLKPLAGKRLN